MYIVHRVLNHGQKVVVRVTVVFRREAEDRRIARSSCAIEVARLCLDLFNDVLEVIVWHHEARLAWVRDDVFRNTALHSYVVDHGVLKRNFPLTVWLFSKPVLCVTGVLFQDIFRNSAKDQHVFSVGVREIIVHDNRHRCFRDRFVCLEHLCQRWCTTARHGPESEDTATEVEVLGGRKEIEVGEALIKVVKLCVILREAERVLHHRTNGR